MVASVLRSAGVVVEEAVGSLMGRVCGSVPYSTKRPDRNYLGIPPDPLSKYGKPAGLEPKIAATREDVNRSRLVVVATRAFKFTHDTVEVR